MKKRVSWIFFLIVWLSVVNHLGNGMYERGIKGKRPTIRFIQHCGFSMKKYRKPKNYHLTKEETKRFTHNLPDKNAYEYYFYHYFFQKCDFDFVCFQDFLNADEMGNTDLVRHFLQNGTSFWLPASDTDPYQWYFRELFAIFQKYHVSSKWYQFIHEADETRDYAHENITRFYTLWKKSYRAYWWDIPEYRELHKNGQLDWIPSRFLKSPEIPFSKQNRSSIRSYNLTFIGNTNTNAKRASHIHEIKTKMNVSVQGLVKPTVAFGVNLVGGSIYLDTMLDSRFCLQFRGRSSECHRLYESMECGCIPVIIDIWETFDYRLQHHSNLDIIGQTFQWQNNTKPPFIWVKNVNEFQKIYHNYLNTRDGLERLDQLQVEMMTWWDQMKTTLQRYLTKEFCLA